MGLKCKEDVDFLAWVKKKRVLVVMCALLKRAGLDLLPISIHAAAKRAGAKLVTSYEHFKGFELRTLNL